MFDAICATVFVLVMAFALWYGYACLMDAIWNSKWYQKIRKETIEALIQHEQLLSELSSEIDNIKIEF
jgi:hypothetical protein